MSGVWCLVSGVWILVSDFWFQASSYRIERKATSSFGVHRPTPRERRPALPSRWATRVSFAPPHPSPFSFSLSLSFSQPPLSQPAPPADVRRTFKSTASKSDKVLRKEVCASRTGSDIPSRARSGLQFRCPSSPLSREVSCFRVYALWFMVYGLWFMVYGSGLMV